MISADLLLFPSARYQAVHAHLFLFSGSASFQNGLKFYCFGLPLRKCCVFEGGVSACTFYLFPSWGSFLLRCFPSVCLKQRHCLKWTGSCICQGVFRFSGNPPGGGCFEVHAPLPERAILSTQRWSCFFLCCPRPRGQIRRGSAGGREEAPVKARSIV
jgi:hypothetical protein